MRWNRQWMGMSGLALILVALAGCATAPIASSLPAAPTALSVWRAPEGLYIGEVVEPPLALQDFTLPSSSGEAMRLSDLNGRWRLMFFGYLHCPDFCPMTLGEFKRVKLLLGEAGETVAFVYISVDGARDTPEALRRYLDNFDTAFIGFSGDDETLARIQPDYGLYYRRRLDSGPQGYYSIDHSTRSYLIDPAGRLRTTFTYDIAPDVIAAAVAWYMEQEKTL